jgi:MoaA/NifB/PqqE/SkfB family radical SAM enzyme
MKRFKKIYVEITNICNLSCGYCSRPERPPLSMTPESFSKICGAIAPFTDYIYLHVKGEPLLHEDLGEMLDICHEKKLKVNIVTNGTLIEGAHDMLLSKPALRQVNFSLHSFTELRETLRSGYLRSIMRFTIEALEKSGLIISLRLWNYDSDRDQGVANGLIFSSLEQYFSLPFDIGEKLNPGRGLKLRDRLYLNCDRRFVWPELDRSESTGRAFCLGLRDQAAILSDGTVVPCCLDAEGIINLGNVHERDFADIIEGERAGNIIRGFSEGRAVEPLCAACLFRNRLARSHNTSQKIKHRK